MLFFLKVDLTYTAWGPTFETIRVSVLTKLFPKAPSEPGVIKRTIAQPSGFGTD